MTALVSRLRSERTTTQLQLVVRLARRQIAQRYRESVFGAAWALLNPLILLGLYWFVFSEVFESRWTGPGSDRPYALLMFSGIILYNLFSEIVNGATTLVQMNSLLIKRTTVSTRVLPLASSLAAMFTLLLNAIPFVVMFIVLERDLPPATALLVPLLVLPLLALSAGIGLIIAAVSAYFRDAQQVVPLMTTATLFLSPIFYPLDALPEGLQPVIEFATPLGLILPASKELLFLGDVPDLLALAGYTAVAAIMFVSGWFVYGFASKGFSDVV